VINGGSSSRVTDWPIHGIFVFSMLIEKVEFSLPFAVRSGVMPLKMSARHVLRYRRQ
jgi:hypothetical protein